MGADDPEAFAAAFAPHADRAAAEVEVGVVEIDEFLNTDAGGIHHLQNRPVAEPGGVVRLWCGEEAADLVASEKAGELPRPPWAAERFRGIAPHPSFAVAKGEEAAHACQFAGHRAGGVPRGVEAGGEPPQNHA